MKCVFCLCAVCVMMLVSAKAAAGVLIGPFVPGSGNWQLINNGGFEAGSTAGWVDYDPQSKGVMRAASDASARGTFGAATITSRDFIGAGFALLQNDVQVGQWHTEIDEWDQEYEYFTGGTYVLSGFIHPGNVTSGTLYLDLADNGCFEINIGAYMNVCQWQFVYGTFTVPDWYECETISVRCVRDGDVRVGQSGYFDEIAVTPIDQFVPPTVIPEPSLAPVLCLAALHRRRVRT